MVSHLDPGNEYMAPWLGGMIAVGYNVDNVKAALGNTPIPPNPFELVFNPVYTSKLKNAGFPCSMQPAMCSLRRCYI